MLQANILAVFIGLALAFGGWWLWRVLREKRRRARIIPQRGDWRNEWKP